MEKWAVGSGPCEKGCEERRTLIDRGNVKVKDEESEWEDEGWVKKTLMSVPLSVLIYSQG